MKHFLALLTILLLTSCGINKIQTVRVNRADKKIVSVSPQEKKDIKHQTEVAEISTPVVEEIPENAISSTSKEEDEQPLIQDEITESSLSTENEQEVEIRPEKTHAKKAYSNPKKEALEAEDNAVRAKDLLILSFFLGLFLFLIPIIIMFIGWGKYTKANNSRYITPKGERALASLWGG